MASQRLTPCWQCLALLAAGVSMAFLVLVSPTVAPWTSSVTFRMTIKRKYTLDLDAGLINSCSDEDRATQAAIFQATERWRNPGWQFSYSGYAGPWIEEIFFNYWSSEKKVGCPIGGRFYLPIFFNLCYRTGTTDEQQAIGDYLRSLDTSKKYFTVLLLSQGLSILGFDPPDDLDLMIFASGGTTAGGKITNVPIPLLIEEKRLEGPPAKKEIFASFAGSVVTHPLRQELYDLYGKRYRFHSLQLGNEVPNWAALMKQSIFCISPRGFGVTSFRLYEALQLGCIPVYIWEDEIMLPFTEIINWNSFAVIIERKNIKQLGQRLQEVDAQSLLAEGAKVRHMMTYNYTGDYILRYLLSGERGKKKNEFSKPPRGVISF